MLLWYPCFENLFSIIRKNKFKNSPINPDDKHLHQLLYFFVNKIIFKNKIIANSFTSLLLNIYNCLVFIISLHNPYNTMFQIILIGVNVIVYVIIYKIFYLFIDFEEKYSFIILTNIKKPSLKALTFFLPPILALSYEGIDNSRRLDFLALIGKFHTKKKIFFQLNSNLLHAWFYP